MRSDVSVFLTVGALLGLQVLSPTAARAQDGIEGGQAGEDRWVPSFSISGGALIQHQDGFADSFQLENGGTTPVPLQGVVTGSDLAVAPFVGGSLEVMSPALPIPTRPRLFLSGEFLPTFASDREVALDGDPGCVKGPRLDDICASELDPEAPLTHTFGLDGANGQGTSTTATFDLLVFGANLGVAFPAQLGRRQLRIKPSVGWISYKVEAHGEMVNAECALDLSTATANDTACTPTTLNSEGAMRETTLTGSASRRYNGVGPGLDIEMDVGRYFGWLGVSLFLGGRAYRTLGDRTIEFDASKIFDDQFDGSQTANDQLGMDEAFANWEVEIDPWIFRAHVGIRFQWLGFPD